MQKMVAWDNFLSLFCPRNKMYHLSNYLSHFWWALRGKLRLNPCFMFYFFFKGDFLFFSFLKNMIHSQFHGKDQIFIHSQKQNQRIGLFVYQIYPQSFIHKYNMVIIFSKINKAKNQLSQTKKYFTANDTHQWLTVGHKCILNFKIFKFNLYFLFL